MIPVLVIIFSYLLGSVSFAIIISRFVKGIDIRVVGSKNAGATNVLRILGKKWGVLVMLLDFFKAFIPVFLLSRLYSSTDINLIKIFMILAIMIGHIFPIWFSFKGGKGVATAAGGITAIFPVTFPISLSIFILTILLTKYVSLASLLSAWTLPIIYVFYNYLKHSEISVSILLFFISSAIIITIFHKKNILNLYNGIEPKTYFRSKNL